MTAEPEYPSSGDRVSSALHPPSERPRTILLAEDDDAVRNFVRVALEQAGFAVLPANDGRSAAALFAAHPERVDLVLTDVIMPHALGTELAANVRRMRPDVPVLFMSAFPGGAGIAPEPLPPDEPLLEKPFTVAALLDAVNHSLRDSP